MKTQNTDNVNASSSGNVKSKSQRRRRKRWMKLRESKRLPGSGKPNDISWYNQNPMLMKIAGLVNFFKRAGRNIVSSLTPASWDPTYTLIHSIPGIARLSWIPTPGVCIDANDALNVALNKMYTEGRLKNLNYSTYDPADMGFYLMACDSIYAFFAYCTLVYNHIKKWNFENQYYPVAIAEALNVNFNNIRDNLAQFLFKINLWKEEIEKLKIPKDIHFIARHMHMSAQIYKDNENEKSQLYVFVPEYLYKYDATGPKLEAVPIGASLTKLTFADIETIMNDMLNRVIPDEDFMTIAADIVKYYQDNFWSVNSLDWDSNQDPVYNKEMLWQIHNADFLPYTSATGLDITQTIDANLNAIVVWNPSFKTDKAGVSLERIVDSNSPVPDAEEIVESTRLKFTVKDFTQVGVNDFSFKLHSCGSEIIAGAKVYFYDQNNQLKENKFGQFIHINHGTPGWIFANDSDLIESLANRVFEYAPIQFWVLQSGANPAQLSLVAINGELDNYAVLDKEQLKDLHVQCLFSMFNLGNNS